MKIIPNFGILASISWNSNKWQDDPTEKDLKASKYDFVIENAHMHESLNFGHEIYPAEEDGSFVAYTPMFNRLPSIEKSKDINIVFFTSSDYQNGNRKCIVGFYGFPEIDEWFPREAKHPKFKEYDGGNVRANVEHIIYFENHLVINNENVSKLELLPEGKKISQQGFNYLNSDNVQNILKLVYQLNLKNEKLKRFLENFPLEVDAIGEINEVQEQLEVLTDENADTLQGIRKLEDKMKKLRPEIKERVSTYIERGAISNKIKKITGYKCLVCEQLGEPAHGFKKSNGEFYVESHHVEPVSKQGKGSLSAANIITVCANHHRQMHYGNVEVIESEGDFFRFKIDGNELIINKIKI